MKKPWLVKLIDILLRLLDRIFFQLLIESNHFIMLCLDICFQFIHNCFLCNNLFM